MAGKATGERISGKKYRAIVEAAAIGDSINLISKTVGVTWRTAKAVVERESREIAERKEALLDLFLDIAQQAAETVKDQLHTATLMQANTIVGSAMDKIALLSRDPTLIIRHAQEHFHPREHHFEAFTRDRFDEILAALPAADAAGLPDAPAPPQAPRMHSHSQPDSSKKALPDIAKNPPGQQADPGVLQ